MVTTKATLMRLLVGVPLLASTLVSAAPSMPGSALERRSDQQQFVLADASYEVPDALTTPHEPDFVEVMLTEAQRKGMDVSQWGVTAEQMDEIVRSTKQSASQATVDLNDEAQRAALLAEAAEEQALAWIQPIIESAPSKTKIQLAVEQSMPDQVKAATQPGSGWIWNVCGSHQEAVVLDDINVKPDPPVPGRNLTVYARGTVNADIEEGAYADVVVKLGFIRLLSRRFDICQLARENDAELQCPLKPGQYEMTHTVELPREIPPARFNVHVSGKTQADVDLMCMDVSIDFSH